MEWTLLTRNQYVTTRWSGGTTTQLAIAPEGAAYAAREFLWRLSSAQVELDHSDFTPLPDYNRLISVLEGQLDMKIGEGKRAPLSPFTVRSFDGGVPVESWGRCTDFNLMLRKGACQGMAQSLILEPGACCAWTAPVAAPLEYPRCTVALYCVSGILRLPEAGVQAASGELLVCREANAEAVSMESKEGAAVMAAVIYFR
ncbi:MAG: HutD family protein [Lawsonibacter sp.]|nr:HutD family protein [Lawsonibacter sp.]